MSRHKHDWRATGQMVRSIGPRAVPRVICTVCGTQGNGTPGRTYADLDAPEAAGLQRIERLPAPLVERFGLG